MNHTPRQDLAVEAAGRAPATDSVRDTHDVPRPDATPEQTDVAALYLAHRTAMWNVARAVLGGRADLVHDVVQNVVEELLRAHRRGTLTPKGNWEAYLVAAVRNAAQRVGGEAADRDAMTISRDDPVHVEADAADPGAEQAIDQVIDREVDDRRLAAALARLSERRRTIIWMSVVGGATRAEIARRLGLSAQAVGQNERHALEQLRKELADDD